ncbi:hypothetical protein [Streptomyces sp. JH34]|uniref:hypothetical protein n=1 Tax=Streptomyces sp. JH34 TaxID=2793633 RepID=UPI0023F8DF0D|nr:hypothetical protein [Streptomyces sp. JH34]MDF6020189.1 hypothetical protein [Streptomyces sp. JH34]
MEQRDAAGYGGCATAALGAATALYVWGSSGRTRRHMGGGFEGQGRDLSVLWTELPLLLLAGALIPSAVWLLTLRLLRGLAPPRSRAVVAAVCAAGVLALSAWALHTWANPHDPDRVRLSGTLVSDLDA